MACFVWRKETRKHSGNPQRQERSCTESKNRICCTWGWSVDEYIGTGQIAFFYRPGWVPGCLKQMVPLYWQTDFVSNCDSICSSITCTTTHILNHSFLACSLEGCHAVMSWLSMFTHVLLNIKLFLLLLCELILWLGILLNVYWLIMLGLKLSLGISTYW